MKWLYSRPALWHIYTACIHKAPKNAIQSQQTDKVGNNGIVEIYDVKSYQIESNVVMEFQFCIDRNLKLNQRFKMNLLRLYSSSLNLTIHRYFNQYFGWTGGSRKATVLHFLRNKRHVQIFAGLLFIKHFFSSRNENQ